MKKVLFFAAFLLIAGITVNAQSEKKSCNQPCTHSEKASTSTDEASVASKAMMAANSSDNIEVKTCEQSGKVSFYKKDVCQKSGKVSYTQVEYQESTGDFAVKASNKEKVNASPEMDDSKKSCSSKASKAECSKEAKAECSKASKASCCKDAKADGKACCSSKASKASMSGKNGCCSGSKKSCSSKS